MVDFTYPFTESSHYIVEVTDTGVTVHRPRGKVRQAVFADISGVYLNAVSQSRTVALGMRDGSTTEFSVLMKHSTGGTPGAPVLDKAAAMEGFHAAAAATLRAVAQARPDLVVELGVSPGTRRLLTIMFGVMAAITLAVVLWQHPVDFNRAETLTPLLGMGVLAGVFVWGVWLRKPRRVGLAEAVDMLAERPPRFPV